MEASRLQDSRAGIRLTLLLCTVALTAAACDAIEREYSYTRAEPAWGRSSPIDFKVRIKVDEKARTVRWLEQASDRDGYLGTTIDTYERCDMFDARNWKCSLFEQNRIELVQGELRQEYWGERRTFRSRLVMPWQRQRN